MCCVCTSRKWLKLTTEEKAEELRLGRIRAGQGGSLGGSLRRLQLTTEEKAGELRLGRIRADHGSSPMQMIAADDGLSTGNGESPPTRNTPDSKKQKTKRSVPYSRTPTSAKRAKTRKPVVPTFVCCMCNSSCATMRDGLCADCDLSVSAYSPNKQVTLDQSDKTESAKKKGRTKSKSNKTEKKKLPSKSDKASKKDSEEEKTLPKSCKDGKTPPKLQPKAHESSVGVLYPGGFNEGTFACVRVRVRVWVGMCGCVLVCWSVCVCGGWVGGWVGSVFVYTHILHTGIYFCLSEQTLPQVERS
jgi:hypothetical protein